MRPVVRALRSLVRFLVVQNCFYMISGFLLLLGCFLMSQSGDGARPDLGEGLELAVILLAYQVTVTGLAIHVRRRLSSENDACNLACVSLVLLLDPTLLSTRLWAHSPEAGLAINGARLLVSIVLFALLARDGGFPISRRSAGAWLAALAGVFLMAGVIEPARATGMAPWLSVLAFLPLVHAALARRWHEPESALPEADGLGASGEPIPVLWGDPRHIYRCYLAAVLMLFPFAVTLIHLVGLAEASRFGTSVQLLAPAVLGAGILLVKIRPAIARTHSNELYMIGLASLFLALPPAAKGPLALAPAVHVLGGVVVANILFGLWVESVSERRGFPAWAALVSLLAACGGRLDSVIHSVTTCDPVPLAVATAWSVWWAARDRGFVEQWVAASMVLGLACRLSGAGAASGVAAFVEGAAVLYLVLVHAYPRKDLHRALMPVACVIAALALAHVHLAVRPTSAGETHLLVVIAAFWSAGAVTPLGGYRTVARGALGFHLVLLAGTWLKTVDLAGLTRAYAGPLVVALAFAMLLVGYKVTRKKEEILRWIDEAE